MRLYGDGAVCPFSQPPDAFDKRGDQPRHDEGVGAARDSGERQVCSLAVPHDAQQFRRLERP